jgi:DNA-binding transcriptional ArsR family regulator
MSTARLDDFPIRANEVAEIAKALSHPARLMILMTLAEKRECICGDLVLDLPLAQSTVSQHLKALKDVGLIRGVIDGPRSKYCVDWKIFESYFGKLSQWGNDMIEWRKHQSC